MTKHRKSTARPRKTGTGVKKAAAKKTAPKSLKKPAKRRTAAPAKHARKTAAAARRQKPALSANAIRLPKEQAAWFNPDRSLEGNSLLKTQVQHFHEMEQRFPEALRSGVPLESIQTEGQAADYIRRVTLLLHRYARPQAHTG